MLPGARDLLASLPAGRWGIVTSGNRVLATARLAASGIALPDVLVTADDVTDGKPDPEGYALAVRRLGATPAGRRVRGRADGIAAARAAGVGTVIGVGGGRSGGCGRDRGRPAGRHGMATPGRGARSRTRLSRLAMFMSGAYGAFW